MTYIYEETAGVPLKRWTRGVPVEVDAIRQLHNIAALPFIHNHVAVMPDVHLGKGATVGSVIATQGAIIPAAVGVDIGCGMMALLTNFTASDLPDSLAGVRSAIEAAVPHGRTDNGGANDRGAWGHIPDHVTETMTRDVAQIIPLVQRHEKLMKPYQRAARQLGTLGTGNHFIEICLDEAQQVWIMLHSGSRGVGNAIGSYFIERAKQDMRRWFINLPDMDLAYIPEGSENFRDYVTGLKWAQNYAKLNREMMMRHVQVALARALGRNGYCVMQIVDCHHNYVAQENHFGKNVWLTRKGAVRAREGDLGIIPGSMGVRSFIVRGKGNPDSFHSCSHGAGRRMSRTAARKTFSLADHEAATVGVECRKDVDVIDETPAAYKDIDAVMAAQSDLVEIVHTLKQVVCVKG